tara:strand:+ start:220 stop:438 length:219 start_codon:yes stop_codon:yes gene_type:complete
MLDSQAIDRLFEAIGVIDESDRESRLLEEFGIGYVEISDSELNRFGRTVVNQVSEQERKNRRRMNRAKKARS